LHSEKIVRELESYFAKEGITIIIPQYNEKLPIPKKDTIPENVILMLKPRFRLLREHYFQNIEAIHQCTKDRAKIEHDLRKGIQDLAHVYLEVQKLRPRFEEVETETNADSVEMHIIAKQRAMINDKRKMIFESKLKKSVVHEVEPIIDNSADFTKKYQQIKNKVRYCSLFLD
jgi:hypothetical protein